MPFPTPVDLHNRVTEIISSTANCAASWAQQTFAAFSASAAAVAVVDVDSSFTQPRCGASQLSRTVSQLHSRNFGLCVICGLLIENGFGRCVIVQNEMN
jgi:peroxiredoxin